MVNWHTVCTPKIFGGLGVKDLIKFSRALRLRWLWLRWQHEERPWKCLPLPCDDTDNGLFAACTSIQIGNGKDSSFWKDRWLNGQSPQDLAPSLFSLSRRKNLSVCDALTDGRWMRGLHRINSAPDLTSFINLWSELSSIQLSPLPDSISCTVSPSGNYSASSAYSVQFIGRIRKPEIGMIWKIKVEGKIKFFLWLLLLNRLWTADRLAARGWRHHDHCCFCDQVLESAFHLAFSCTFAKQVWLSMRQRSKKAFDVASSAASIGDGGEG